eukprot:14648462-Alexandrium_andersonii.AAC.1
MYFSLPPTGPSVNKLLASRCKVPLRGGATAPPGPPDWRLWRERPHQWGYRRPPDTPEKRLRRAKRASSAPEAFFPPALAQ